MAFSHLFRLRCCVLVVISFLTFIHTSETLSQPKPFLKKIPVSSEVQSKSQNSLDTSDVPYLVQYIQKSGSYVGASDNNKKKYVITVSSANVKITANGGINYFDIAPSSNVTVTITDFHATSDIIDLSQFSSVRSFTNLDYSTSPLTLYLPLSSIATEKLIITLSSHSSFDLTTQNFIYSSSSSSSSSSSGSSVNTEAVITAVAVLGFLIIISGIVFYFHNYLFSRCKSKVGVLPPEAKEQMMMASLNQTRSPSRESSTRSTDSRRSTRSRKSSGGSIKSKRRSEKGSKRITNDFQSSVSTNHDDFGEHNEHLFSSDCDLEAAGGTILSFSDFSSACKEDDIEKEDDNDHEESTDRIRRSRAQIKRDSHRPSLPVLREESNEHFPTSLENSLVLEKSEKADGFGIEEEDHQPLKQDQLILPSEIETSYKTTVLEMIQL
jgi:hypothetical protein